MWLAYHVRPWPGSFPASNRPATSISATTWARCGSWAIQQYENDAFYCIVDLHALTLDIDPAALRARTIDAAVNLLAAGLDPDRCTLFVQSHVPEHPRLTWLLECTATDRRAQPDDPVQGQGPRATRAHGPGSSPTPS